MKKFVVFLISMVSVFGYSCNRDESHVSACRAQGYRDNEFVSHFHNLSTQKIQGTDCHAIHAISFSTERCNPTDCRSLCVHNHYHPFTQKVVVPTCFWGWTPTEFLRMQYHLTPRVTLRSLGVIYVELLRSSQSGGLSHFQSYATLEMKPFSFFSHTRLASFRTQWGKNWKKIFFQKKLLLPLLLKIVSIHICIFRHKSATLKQPQKATF